MTDPSTHRFWITSRAAGISALVLASAAVCAGIALGGRIAVLRGRSAQLRTAHEALSIAALAALAVHGRALLGDGYLRPSLRDELPATLDGAGDRRRLWPGRELLVATVVVPPLALLAMRLARASDVPLGLDRGARRTS